MAENRISRRDVLRNAALVGVGAWAAPALASLPAEAAARRNVCSGVKGNCKAGFTQCSNCGSEGGSFCFEVLDSNGVDNKKTVCAENALCRDVSRCRNSQQCPNGYVCATNNACTHCKKASGVCLRKSPRRCAEVRVQRSARKGLTAAGVR